MSPIEAATREALIELIDSEIIGGGGQFYQVVAEHLGRDGGLSSEEAEMARVVVSAIMSSLKRWEPPPPKARQCSATKDGDRCAKGAGHAGSHWCDDPIFGWSAT